MSTTATTHLRPRRLGVLRFGVGSALRTGVGSGVGLEPDPRTDPAHYPTMQVRASLTGSQRAATDPLRGITGWGNSP